MTNTTETRKNINDLIEAFFVSANGGASSSWGIAGAHEELHAALASLSDDQAGLVVEAAARVAAGWAVTSLARVGLVPASLAEMTNTAPIDKLTEALEEGFAIANYAAGERVDSDDIRRYRNTADTVYVVSAALGALTYSRDAIAAWAKAPGSEIGYETALKAMRLAGRASRGRPAFASETTAGRELAARI